MSKTWKDNDRKHDNFADDYEYSKFKREGKRQKKDRRRARADRDRQYDYYYGTL